MGPGKPVPVSTQSLLFILAERVISGREPCLVTEGIIQQVKKVLLEWFFPLPYLDHYGRSPGQFIDEIVQVILVCEHDKRGR